MGRKYDSDKVTVLHVLVFQNPPSETGTEYVKTLEKFVQKYDDMMQYSVAADTPDWAMGNSYMKAIGAEGAGQAFVIDGNGRIVFSGHDYFVETCVDELLAGTFDLEEFSARHQKLVDANDHLWDLLLKGSSTEDALNYLDSKIEDGTFKPTFWDLALKFKLMLHSNREEAAYKLGWKLLEENQNNDLAFYTLSGNVGAIKKLKHPDYDLFIAFARQGQKLTRQPMELSQYMAHEALAYAYRGDFEKSRQIIKKAQNVLEGCESPGVENRLKSLAKEQQFYEENKVPK